MDTPWMHAATTCTRQGCPSDSATAWPIVEHGITIALLYRCDLCGLFEPRPHSTETRP